MPYVNVLWLHIFGRFIAKLFHLTKVSSRQQSDMYISLKSDSWVIVQIILRNFSYRSKRLMKDQPSWFHHRIPIPSKKNGSVLTLSKICCYHCSGYVQQEHANHLDEKVIHVVKAPSILTTLLRSFYKRVRFWWIHF